MTAKDTEIFILGKTFELNCMILKNVKIYIEFNIQYLLLTNIMYIVQFSEIISKIKKWNWRKDRLWTIPHILVIWQLICQRRNWTRKINLFRQIQVYRITQHAKFNLICYIFFYFPHFTSRSSKARKSEIKSVLWFKNINILAQD